jgi:OOP family OmpA-OmpF porin
MKATYLFIILFAISLPNFAQEVQWASQVLEYSSQFGKRQYSVNQVVGKPNVLPNLGASPNAWAPRKKDKYEYVKVAFDRPTKIKQIAIAETHNPGGIHKILHMIQKATNIY